jgi:hypothetical protein
VFPSIRKRVVIHYVALDLYALRRLTSSPNYNVRTPTLGWC